MKAVYIYPEDIGTTEYSETWLTFIRKLGFTGGEVWNHVLVTPIDIN